MNDDIIEPITVRFWFNGDDGDKAISFMPEVLKELNPTTTVYTGLNKPYKYFCARIVLVFDIKTMKYFGDALEHFIKLSPLSEILVKDKWIKLD